MKKLFTAFALAGFVGLTACAADEEPELMEEPVVEEPAQAPVVTQPAPMTTDTMMTDTMAAPGDTAM